MQISSISDILSGIEKVSSVNGTHQDQNFTDILNQAIDDAQETDAQATLVNQNLLTGENESIHTAMIASEKAELALNLAIQIRNKVIDAYNEVMRMQL